MIRRNYFFLSLCGKQYYVKLILSQNEKMFFLVLLILIAGEIKAQIIRVDNGISFSSIHDYIFHKKIYPYHFSLGIDYLDRNFFYLSSDVGYIRKGGQYKINVFDQKVNGDFKIGVHLDYITVSTLANFKYRLTGKTECYVGVGPRLDFKINRKYFSEDEELYQLFTENAPHVKTLSVGLKCQMGINYSLSSRFFAGIYFSYLPSFAKVFKVKEDQVSFGNSSFGKDRLFGIGISLGYKI